MALIAAVDRDCEISKVDARASYKKSIFFDRFPRVFNGESPNDEIAGEMSAS